MVSDYSKFLGLFGVGGAHPGGLCITEKLLQNEQISPNMKILDAGCGTGQTSAYLYNTYQCDVHPVDLQKIMVEKANERFKRLGFSLKALNHNVQQLPYSDESFDMILSESVLMFTNTQKTLQEFNRLLKPSGILLLNEMCRVGTLEESDVRSFREFYGVSPLKSVSEWKTLLSRTGFHISETINEVCDDYSVEFHLSEDIQPELYEVMDQHEDFTKTFKGKIDHCIIRAQK